MKKILSIIISFTLSISLMSGCSKTITKKPSQLSSNETASMITSAT